MENADPLRIALAFGLVISLIGLFALALRTLSHKYPRWFEKSGGTRLQVVESRMLDARRKLVLVRRDEQEHLLLLSAQGDLVIERIEKKDVSHA